jgi:DNA modification methylase
MNELIKQGIKVDVVITDPPYGTTQCKWDNIIPFEPMWNCINNIIKTNAAICLFGSEPFSSQLRVSNIKNYKYDWIWEKNKAQGFLNAKKMPLKGYENLSIFYNKPCTYNPQGLIKIDKVVKNTGTKNITSNKENGDKTSANNSIKNKYYKQEFTNYPNMILKFSNSGNKSFHPTQKPVDLLEYLINTYTNENETVLDFTMGSGSTGVACMNTNRRFIGIEKEEKYCKIAEKRISDAIK